MVFSFTYDGMLQAISTWCDNELLVGFYPKYNSKPLIKTLAISAPDILQDLANDFTYDKALTQGYNVLFVGSSDAKLVNSNICNVSTWHLNPLDDDIPYNISEHSIIPLRDGFAFLSVSKSPYSTNIPGYATTYFNNVQVTICSNNSKALQYINDIQLNANIAVYNFAGLYNIDDHSFVLLISTEGDENGLFQTTQGYLSIFQLTESWEIKEVKHYYFNIPRGIVYATRSVYVGDNTIIFDMSGLGLYYLDLSTIERSINIRSLEAEIEATFQTTVRYRTITTEGPIIVTSTNDVYVIAEEHSLHKLKCFDNSWQLIHGAISIGNNLVMLYGDNMGYVIEMKEDNVIGTISLPKKEVIVNTTCNDKLVIISAFRVENHNRWVNESFIYGFMINR
jgi:hypothetical protein